MKNLLYTLAILAVVSCTNTEKKNDKSKFDLQVKEITKNQLPDDIEFDGTLITAKQWHDKNGENILVVSFNGPLPENEPLSSNKEKYAKISAQQFLKDDKTYTELWRMKDAQRNCPFDLWIGLLPNSTTITDLNDNGITETSLIYKKTCRSDLTPSHMSVVIHENKRRYALKGMMVDPKMPPFDTIEMKTFEINKAKAESLFQGHSSFFNDFGKYKNEKDFKNAPKEFLEHARKLWREYYTKDEPLQF